MAQTKQEDQVGLETGLGFACHHYEAIPLATAAKLAAYAGFTPRNNTACARQSKCKAYTSVGAGSIEIIVVLIAVNGLRTSQQQQAHPLRCLSGHVWQCRSALCLL